jgi:hypothetical protein
LGIEFPYSDLAPGDADALASLRIIQDTASSGSRFLPDQVLGGVCG